MKKQVNYIVNMKNKNIPKTLNVYNQSLNTKFKDLKDFF